MSAPGHPRRLAVGLTGGLGSGKSTVAARLAAAGCRVLDADRLVAELYAPGGDGARAVADLFGPEMLDPAGGVDHARLAQKVFRDREALTRLEAAIHPLVRRRFEAAARDLEGIVVLEATLLVEAGYGPVFDYVVTVEADPERRVARSIARGMTEEEARARLAAQGDGGWRRGGADRVIDNDGDLAALDRQVDELLAELRHRLDGGD